MYTVRLIKTYLARLNVKLSVNKKTCLFVCHRTPTMDYIEAKEEIVLKGEKKISTILNKSHA